MGFVDTLEKCNQIAIFEIQTFSCLTYQILELKNNCSMKKMKLIEKRVSNKREIFVVRLCYIFY